MALSRRSRFVVVAAGLAGVALIAALAVGIQPKAGGPELAAPGANHFAVTAAQSAGGPVEIARGVFIGADQKHDTSAPLRSLKPDPVRALPLGDEEGDQGGGRPAHANVADPVVQSSLASPAMPATSNNFDGILYPGVACNCAPPDTNGEVGATQYVQIVNEGFQVWNKSTGASVYGPAGITTIWSSFGGVCQSSGYGDPVVLYDQLAGRWLVSQFAGTNFLPTDECIAISTTSDATGSWYRYDFHLGSNFFDYPKLAVWPDGYYMSMNIFNSSGTSFLGPQAFVFDRAKMLTGAAATFQTPGVMGSSFDPMLPADIDGSSLPPTGAKESFVMWPGNGTYATYHYHVDWVTPANSTFSLFSSPAAAGFTQLCPTTRACVPQAGVTSSSYLDALADRLMFRLAYRNFGDHESVVGNFTVSSGGVAGIRWFELRNVTNGPETVYQESTYQPDSTWRWMGSAAMDHNGDIALGFNASSSSIDAQLRYAGRLASDPLGTLGQGEATLFAGTGAQSGTSNRWGDYSDLTVDPVDDCTFWFTGEYYSVNASFNWRTRIGSFVMPGCGSSPTTGSIAGTVTDTNTTKGVAGATVAITNGPSTTTDASGNYSFSGLNPATYTLTATKLNYTSGSAQSGTVTAGSTTTVPLTLTSTTGSISGKVTDSSTSAAIVGATVQISGGGLATTDASGNYSFPSLAGGSYSLMASATGYASSAATPVTVSNGFNTVQNFSLTPTMFSTTFVFPTSAVAGSGGDGNGYQSAPAGWFSAFDGLVASDAKSGTAGSLSCTSAARDSEVFSGYSLGNLGSSILGIRVQLRGRVNSSSGSPSFCIQISSDSGAHWTTGQTTSTLSGSLATYTLGATSDTWGRSWSTADFGSGFRVRIVDLSTSTQRTFYLDGVSVSVTYQ